MTEGDRDDYRGPHCAGHVCDACSRAWKHPRNQRCRMPFEPRLRAVLARGA